MGIHFYLVILYCIRENFSKKGKRAPTFSIERTAGQRRPRRLVLYVQFEIWQAPPRKTDRCYDPNTWTHFCWLLHVSFHHSNTLQKNGNCHPLDANHTTSCLQATSQFLQQIRSWDSRRLDDDYWRQIAQSCQNISKGCTQRSKKFSFIRVPVPGKIVSRV